MSTATPDFGCAQGKIDRAREHFHEFERECTAYLAGSPYAFPCEIGDDGRRHTHRIRIDRPIPARLGLLAGDGIHNLRAALDRLACELLVKSGGTPGPQTEFPIFCREEEFRKAGRRKLRGMRPEIKDAIEAEQPYNSAEFAKAPKWHPLWVIHELDTADRHREPAVLAAALPGLGVPLAWKGLIRIPGKFNRSLQDGDVIAEFLFEEPQPELTYDLNVTSEVFLPGIPGPLPVPARRQLADLFTYVVRYLAPGLLALD